jgi:hypothetical protein
MRYQHGDFLASNGTKVIDLTHFCCCKGDHVKSTLKTLLFTLLLSVCVYGQRDLGTVLGTVTDAQGGAVPGAKINILEDATGLKYTVETNANGEYIRPLLKPGTYSIEA